MGVAVQGRFDVSDLDIRFEPTAKGGRYYVVMPNGEQSRLTYVKGGANHIVADHTFVPPPYRNQGVGDFNLPTRAYDEKQSEHTVQVTETAMLSPQAVNESRFQFQRHLRHLRQLKAGEGGPD